MFFLAVNRQFSLFLNMSDELNSVLLVVIMKETRQVHSHIVLQLELDYRH